MPLSVAAACSSKLKPRQKALAEGQAPGLVDAAAERRVQDELLASTFVEEAFGDDGVLRRHGTEDGSAGNDIGDELARSRFADATAFYEPADCRGDFGHVDAEM